MDYQYIFALNPDTRLDYLRKLYLDSPVGRNENRPFYYSGDRWLTLSFLEGWEHFRDKPTTVLRRAYSEAYVLDCSKPLIDSQELIVGRPDFEPYTAEEQKKFERLVEAFPMMPSISRKGRTDHLALDYAKLLRIGVEGLMQEISERSNALCLDGGSTYAQNLAKQEFYEGCRVELEALLRLADRYAQHARALAKEIPEKAESMMEIARIMERVPRYPATTFREALQSVHFYTFCLFGLYAAGRPDRYLLPYYEADRKAKRITLEEAQLLIDQYCMLMNTCVLSSAAVSLMIGGSDKTGLPVENELTALFLNSISHTRMAEPSIGLCLTDTKPSPILKKALNLLAEGHTHPALYNDKAIRESLVSYGVLREDTSDYINTTCVEISISGKTNAWTTCPWINLAQLLLDTMHLKRYENIEELFEAYVHCIRNHVQTENNLMSRLQMERARNGAMPLRVSCLVDDCLERGMSLAQGGARYNPVFPTFVGLGNVVDSFSALEKIVFIDKQVDFDVFVDILDQNFENHELIRQTILDRVVHYGNDDFIADRWAKRLTKLLKDSCVGLPTYRGSSVVPAIFSFSLHGVMGEHTGATPDGRKAGMPLADSCGAVQGRDIEGPTASILSVTCWNNAAFIGGIALNMRFTRDIMLAQNGEAVRALIQTFFERGGVQLQVNSADTEVLKAAKERPEEYGDLLVRVGGYSDYFVRLPEKVQNEIIERTQQM